MAKSFTLAIIEVQNKALLPVCWDHTVAENSLCQLSRQLNSFLTSSFQHLSYDARWASSLAAFNFVECFVDRGCGHTVRGASSWRDLGELIAWPLKFNIEQPSIVLNSCIHIAFISARKLTSIFAYTVLINNVWFCGPSIWQCGKHHHYLGLLWRIPLSLPQTLPARWYV